MQHTLAAIGRVCTVEEDEEPPDTSLCNSLDDNHNNNSNNNSSQNQHPGLSMTGLVVDPTRWTVSELGEKAAGMSEQAMGMLMMHLEMAIPAASIHPVDSAVSRSSAQNVIQLFQL